MHADPYVVVRAAGIGKKPPRTITIQAGVGSHSDVAQKAQHCSLCDVSALTCLTAG